MAVSQWPPLLDATTFFVHSLLLFGRELQRISGEDLFFFHLYLTGKYGEYLKRAGGPGQYKSGPDYRYAPVCYSNKFVRYIRSGRLLRFTTDAFSVVTIFKNLTKDIFVDLFDEFILRSNLFRLGQTCCFQRFQRNNFVQRNSVNKSTSGQPVLHLIRGGFNKRRFLKCTRRFRSKQIGCTVLV